MPPGYLSPFLHSQEGRQILVTFSSTLGSMATTIYKAKRLSLGVLAALAVGLILGLLPSINLSTPPYRLLGYFFIEPGIQSFFGVALAMFVGAYVARVNFVTTAIALTVASAIGVTFILQAIAEPVEHQPFFEIVAFNSVNHVLGLVGAVVGASLGESFCQRQSEETPHAA